MDDATKARIFKEGGKILGDLVKVVMTRSTKHKESVEVEDVQIGVTPIGNSEPSITTTPVATTSSLPTTEETTRELKRRLAKELYRAELDLSAKLRIAGKPCDCLSDKHTLMLEAAAEELISNEPHNPVYFEIIEWIKVNQAKVTIPAISTGQYEYEYPVMAAQFRDFRKRVLGTTQLNAMVEPREGSIEDSSNPIKSIPREGTWICPECGRLNDSYPYSTRCSRCNYFHKVEKSPEPSAMVELPQHSGEKITEEVTDDR